MALCTSEMAAPKYNQILLKIELLSKESTLDFLSDLESVLIYTIAFKLPNRKSLGSNGFDHIRKTEQILPLRVESKLQNRLVDDFVLAHSNVPVAKLKTIADAQFLFAISEGM